MMRPTTWIVMAALAHGGAAAAQPPPTPLMEGALAVQQVQGTQEHLKVVRVPVDEGMRVTVQGRITRGAPYSADMVTESAQVLADGNRIVRRSVTRAWRDSEGRTRTEEMGTQGVQSVAITDPASGETWMLDPQTRTAFRAGVFVHSPAGGVPGGVPGGATAGATTATGEGKVVIAVQHDPAQAPPPPPPPPPVSAGAVGVTGGLWKVEEGVKVESQVTREDLGQQKIEGLTATGTRTTTVIPAGAIGNELPIRVVSEQWYSPELQRLVLTKFSDPRSGETTFRMTNVSRAEPDPSLFTVPPDYTVKESKIRHETR